MKKLLLMLMTLAFALPVAIAGEKTVTISRNEGIYQDSEGVYYCSKGGITMTFSSGMNNINYLVEHQQVIFYIRSDNYVIKKIKFNCLDNTTNDNLDCFYWGPSTIHELEAMATYTPTGNYTSSGYIGTWVAGATDSKDVKFRTEGKPVRFGSVEITYEKEFGDVYDLVTKTSELNVDSTYVLVSQRDSRALGKEEYHPNDNYTTFSSTPVTLLNSNMKVRITDEVQLIKLQQSTSTNRPWLLKVGDNYIRRRNGDYTSGSGTNQGYNLFSVSTLPTYESDLYNFRVSISFGNNNNALISYYHGSGDTFASGRSLAIRHYNGGDLFRVMDWSNANADATYQRVYLYKPARSYEVTTECLPANGGYITLDNGILTDNQGKNWSQQYDNVTFFVGPTNGYGIGEVTLTDLNTRAVTVLQPTGTSDFGNDYSFEMPANDVKITANFTQPYEIHTVNIPVEGGDFNFINGYTDFNGQPMSNEGKTVTFTVVPTENTDYKVTSVTYTNDVTGESTTLTPDANGVYSFVMPGNSVTLTADYELAGELYLLGTANGEISWHPYGPKFNYDATNDKYYLDVYFKGGNSDPNTDPAYGYFSLTKKIDLDGNWNNISGHRLAAEYNNYWVEDGYTGITLYGDRDNNAFKIKPGVYRIEVNAEMNQMSITEYALTLTFDPESGSTVAVNDVVTISSNLDSLVHSINANEVNASFKNRINDNWNWDNDNTATITTEGTTTVHGEANIGYITVPGQATYDVISDLYLLGTAIGRTTWASSGPKFNYDAVNEEYYLDVYFKGGEANLPTGPEYQNYGYFSLATHVSDFDWTQRTNCPGETWSQVWGRYGAQYDDFGVSGGSTNVPLYGDGNHDDDAFKIPAGIYRITVNKGKTLMNITQIPVHIFFDPAGGTVEAGTVVTISSDLQSLVWPIAATYGMTEIPQNFRIRTDDMGEDQWNDNGQHYDNNIVITREGETTIVTGYVEIGFIFIEDTAHYTVPAPPVYNISTRVDPQGAGVITAPESSIAGETITFTVSTNPNYELDNVEVCLPNGQILPLTDNGNGTYSFTMPDNDVTIYADYVRVSYNVIAVCVPDDAGHFNFINMSDPTGLAPGTLVQFTVSAHTGYRLLSVTTSYVDENNVTHTATLERDSDGEYYFYMPAADVTLTALFERNYNITTVCVPSEGGQFFNSASSAPAGTSQRFSVVANSGYQLREVIMTYVDENDETQTGTLTFDGTYYYYTMPAADVTLTAYFDPLYSITTQCTPPNGGTINLNTSSALEGTPISFTVTPNSGYTLVDVTVSYVDENDMSQVVTLTPDENGVYNFTMPGAPVTINANFANLPFGISTVCDPIEGGTINVASSAYTNDEVTFTVEKSQGYQVNSVTVTNTVTGQEIVFTQGENGQYRFVMPDAAVVITANFTPISDLYLLGTANGETEWAPTGPKFDYDPVNDEYTLTVYYKGIRDVAGQNDDKYGHFSLTTVVHESDWDAIAPYRLVANSEHPIIIQNNLPTMPGQATVPLCSPADGYDVNNHYRVPAGIYTLTVPGDKSSVTVTRIPVSITLTPDRDFVELGSKKFVTYGTVVTASSDLEQTVHGINPNEDNATFIMIEQERPEDSSPDADTIPGNQYVMTYEGNVELRSEAYIGWIVPYITDFYSYRPLRFIEGISLNIKADQIVCDTLVGVWAAERILWAKDLGNRSLETDTNEYNLKDYGIDIAHMQDPERGWDQSNWVMLDFTDYLDDIGCTSDDEALGVMNSFVNKMIEPLSIQGYYFDERTYRIMVYDKPKVLKDTIGYPGYLQDPLELLANPTDATEPVIYHYNHYTPCNFMGTTVITYGPESGIAPPEDWDEFAIWIRNYSDLEPIYDFDYSDPDSWTDEQWELFDAEMSHWYDTNGFFFVRGKASEVAHVWAVWRGGDEDVFDVYERSISENGDTIYNQFDLDGAFRVGGWQYNRLTPNPAYYGKPEGLNSLHPNEAYEFHIAIMKPGYLDAPSKKAPRRSPVAKGCNPNDSEYLIYPLDLKSHDDNVTYIPELTSQITGKTIHSVRYYNLMGQESKTPFDGINIEVTRYSDGSMTTRKILR